MDDPLDPVGVVVLDHDQAGVAGGDAAPQRRLDRLRGVDGDHRRDRRHHLARLLLVQVEDAGEVPGLARVEATALGAARDQQPQLLRRGLLGDRVRVDAEEHADDPVGRPVGGEDQRVQGGAEELQRPGDFQQHGLGAGDRQHLRRLLAEDHVQEGDEGEGDRDRDRNRRGVSEEVAEQRLEQLRQRRLAEEADAQRGERDPDLTGGDVLVDVVDQLEPVTGRADPFVAQLLEPGAARADDRELGRDEEAVDRNQQQKKDEQDDAHRLCGPGTSGWDVVGHSANAI